LTIVSEKARVIRQNLYEIKTIKGLKVCYFFMFNYFAVFYLKTEYFDSISFIFGRSEWKVLFLVKDKTCALNVTF